MKYKTMCAIILLLVVLSGCGSRSVIINIECLSDEIMEKAQFEEKLYRIENDMLASIYNLKPGIDGIAYAGTGATAEELAVFDAVDETYAKELELQLKKRITDRVEDYKGYLPDEVYKLENAVVERTGQYVILCVAENSAPAETALREARKLAVRE